MTFDNSYHWAWVPCTMWRTFHHLVLSWLLIFSSYLPTDIKTCSPTFISQISYTSVMQISLGHFILLSTSFCLESITIQILNCSDSNSSTILYHIIPGNIFLALSSYSIPSPHAINDLIICSDIPSLTFSFAIYLNIEFFLQHCLSRKETPQNWLLTRPQILQGTLF